jgi:hypothetical protein
MALDNPVHMLALLAELAIQFGVFALAVYIAARTVRHTLK